MKYSFTTSHFYGILRDQKYFLLRLKSIFKICFQMICIRQLKCDGSEPRPHISFLCYNKIIILPRFPKNYRVHNMSLVPIGDLLNVNIQYSRCSFKPESQNFLDPGLAKPQSQLNLGFKIQTLVKHNRTIMTQLKLSFDFYNLA